MLDREAIIFLISQAEVLLIDPCTVLIVLIMGMVVLEAPVAPVIMDKQVALD
jgi:hypothetical protein